MADFKIKEDDLMNYMRGMIVYAIRVHRADVINLLMQVGVNVPKDIDDKTLHAVVLRTILDSDTFGNNLANLLHAIAMEGEHSKMDGDFANADATNNPSTSTNTDKKSWSNVFSPETLTGLLSTGFGYLSQKLKSEGEKGIKDEVEKGTPNPPEPPTKQPKKFPWLGVIGLTAVIGATFVIIHKMKKKDTNITA